MSDSQSVPKQQLLELTDFTKLSQKRPDCRKSSNSWKKRIKRKLPEKRGFMEKRKTPAPRANPHL